MKFVILGDSEYVVPLDQVMIKRRPGTRTIEVFHSHDTRTLLHKAEAQTLDAAIIKAKIKEILSNTLTID